MVLFGKIFFSKFNLGILVDSNMNAPKPMMIIPPTWFKSDVNVEASLESTLFRITPNIENTTENPRTKNIVFIKTLSLLVARLIVPLFC